jgi:hypothetical protein
MFSVCSCYEPELDCTVHERASTEDGCCDDPFCDFCGDPISLEAKLEADKQEKKRQRREVYPRKKRRMRLLKSFKWRRRALRNDMFRNDSLAVSHLVERERTQKELEPENTVEREQRRLATNRSSSLFAWGHDTDCDCDFCEFDDGEDEEDDQEEVELEMVDVTGKKTTQKVKRAHPRKRNRAKGPRTGDGLGTNQFSKMHLQLIQREKAHMMRRGTMMMREGNAWLQRGQELINEGMEILGHGEALQREENNLVNLIVMGAWTEDGNIPKELDEKDLTEDMNVDENGEALQREVNNFVNLNMGAWEEGWNVPKELDEKDLTEDRNVNENGEERTEVPEREGRNA